MGRAKEIEIKPISSKDANRLCKLWHYSGKVAAISQIHLGAFLDDKCYGVMQFGPPIDRRKLLPLVRGTKFNNFLELNRMAFSDMLPKNSESRSISIAMKIIKKKYPHIDWIVSFADGTQCGDGTIYRAANFVLTQIKENSTIYRMKSGEISAKHGTSNKDFSGAERLRGFQLRYIYFINKEARERLTVPIIPFDKIKEVGATMYKGQRGGSINSNASGYQLEEGGATPTSPLQLAPDG